MSKLLLSALLACLLLFPVTKNHATLNPHQALFDPREVTCLAKAVYHESRGEVLAGQYAVAKTVVNRAMSSVFPKTICGVVYQPGQFTGILQLRIKDKNSWERATDIAYVVLNMQGNHNFKALYFHTKQVSPNWKRKRLAVIGNHVFYT
jgi:N-acetylmuramoyl-L-alanine amidase